MPPRTKPSPEQVRELLDASNYEDPELLLQAMGERLQFSWERYITFIHEVLLLTGGTILVLLNVMVGKDSRMDVEVAAGVTALVLAVMGMVAGMGWRLTSQYFMDREVLGAKEDVAAYFALVGFHSASDYEGMYYAEQGAHRFYAWLFGWVAWATVALLFAAWIAGGLMMLFR